MIDVYKRQAHHIAHRRDDFLHTHLSVIRFELRQLLETERHAHLVACLLYTSERLTGKEVTPIIRELDKICNENY